jgi:hypothetical protein
VEGTGCDAMSARLPSHLLRSHNRIGALLTDLGPEDAATILIDQIELMGIQGTVAWTKFLDRHRKRTRTKPEQDRNPSGVIPDPVRSKSSDIPASVRYDATDPSPVGGKGGSLSSVISADLSLDPSDESAGQKEIIGNVTDTARAKDNPGPAPALALVPPPGAKGSKAPRRAGVKTTIPDGFGVSAAMEQMCREEDLPDPHVVMRQFRDDCVAKGRMYVDWEAAFRGWMRSTITASQFPPWSRSAESERERERSRGAEVKTPGKPLFTLEQLGLAAEETPSVDLDNDGFEARIDEVFGEIEEGWK